MNYIESKSPIFKSNLMIPNLILFFAVLLISSCATETTTNENKEVEEFNFKVNVAEVMEGNISDTIQIFGTTALRQKAWLSSQFEGRISNFNLLKGEKVKKGELLATIIPASREALLQIKNNVAPELRALLDDQKKAIPLYSPITGTVMEVMLHAGDVVNKGDHIAEVADLSVLDIQGELPIQYIQSARLVKNIIVCFEKPYNSKLHLPIETFTGNVNKNQSLLMRIRLDNTKRNYFEGLRLQILIPEAIHKNAILIPRSALLEEEGEYSVFTLNTEHVEKMAVKTGIMKANTVEILSGLSIGQKVVIDKVYSLKDNQKVVVNKVIHH